jgi:hypothetical protein
MQLRRFAIAAALALGLTGAVSAAPLGSEAASIDPAAATLRADYAKHGGPHWNRGRGHHYGWYKHRGRGHHYGRYHQRRHYGWRRGRHHGWHKRHHGF